MMLKDIIAITFPKTPYFVYKTPKTPSDNNNNNTFCRQQHHPMSTTTTIPSVDIINTYARSQTPTLNPIVGTSWYVSSINYSPMPPSFYHRHTHLDLVSSFSLFFLLLEMVSHGEHMGCWMSLTTV